MEETIKISNKFVKVLVATLKKSEETGLEIVDREFYCYLRPLNVCIIVPFDRDPSKSIITVAGQQMLVLEEAESLSLKFEKILDYT